VAGDPKEMMVAGRGIGIDVGSHSVKVAVVRRQLGGLVLERVVEQPVARDGAGRPSLEALSEAVSAAVAGVRVGRALVVVGTPTQLATVRNLDVPFHDETKIRQVVKTEVEPHLPFSAEEIVVDYCLTGVQREPPAEPAGAPAPTNLLITAVQKKVVGDLLGTVRAEGLDPEVVDVEFMGALSAARALAPGLTEGGELVIDVGAVKTSVIYAHDGRPLAVRSINVGGDALTQAVAQATGAGFAEAEAAKANHAVPVGDTGETDAVGKALAEALVALRRGLDQTLRFFASQVGEPDYERVVLTGGSAALGGLREWFAAALAKDVTVLDSLGPVKNAAGDDVGVMRYATAIGLAIGGVGEGVALHNFRREELVYPNPLKRLVKYLAPAVGLIVAMVAAAIAGYFISYQSTLAEEREYRDIKEKELRKIVGKSMPYVTLEAAKKQVDERAAELESLRGENPQSVLDVLYALSVICYEGKMPAEDYKLPSEPEAATQEFIRRSGRWKIQIASFQMERGRVEIEGTAASYVAMNQFKNALQASPLFKEVKMKESREVQGRATFKIWLYLEERQRVR
jgi:type IV pilus assembly protein PilM